MGLSWGDRETSEVRGNQATFSHNLYEALCQSQKSDDNSQPAQADDSTVMEAIERAMETYQRLFAGRDAAE